MFESEAKGHFAKHGRGTLYKNTQVTWNLKKQMIAFFLFKIKVVL